MISARRHLYSALACLVPVLAAVLLLALGSTAVAQDSVRIPFKPGATSTTINGTIIGDEYIDYVVGARGGQAMVVSLAVTGTNGNGSAYFNILPAGQDYPALFNGSTGGRRAEVTLPSSGDWAIRVYLMGNDADTGKTVGYSIDVYIAPGGGSQGAGSSGSGSGALPEEDFFVVRTSGGGVLNVRDAPRASARKIGEFRNGTVLRNVGGCTMSDGQQWCNVQTTTGGVIGWVAARFLALPGPGNGGSENSGTADDGGGAMAGANNVQVTGVPANDVLNVRSGPGTGYRIVGALGNEDRVRNLGCRHVGNARWCEIEMMTDMRERGWVNARYLTSGVATQLPENPGGKPIRAAGQIPCTNQVGPTMFDCSFKVVQRQNGAVRLTVTFPTANTRRITFRDGVPVSSDADARLSYQQIGDMTEVFIGNIERFRVPDAVIYGG